MLWCTRDLRVIECNYSTVWTSFRELRNIPRIACLLFTMHDNIITTVRIIKYVFLCCFTNYYVYSLFAAVVRTRMYVSHNEWQHNPLCMAEYCTFAILEEYTRIYAKCQHYFYVANWNKQRSQIKTCELKT